MKQPPMRMIAGVLTAILTFASAYANVGLPPLAAAQIAPAREFAVTIHQRKVTAADNVIRVTQGDAVEIVITADEAAELHLHGYDLKLTLTPGVPGTIRFTAAIAGRFPLEAHQFGTEPSSGRHRGGGPLLYVEVYPR
jgi:FtsP/CotA-like multicopper oxidase with cupredoxin domain